MYCFYSKKYMTYLKLLLVAACVCFTICCGAQNFELSMLKEINEDRSSFKDGLFKFTSKSVNYVNVAAPLTVLTAGLLKHDKQLQRDAMFMIGGFAVSSIVTQTLKNTIKKNRPYVQYSYIKKRDAGGGYSFPSGHTSAAFCSATSLSLLYPKWYVIVPCYTWASCVAYGRMYEGVHYPSDVLAGAIVGAGSAWLSYKVEKWYSKKYNRKNNTAVSFAL